MEERRQSSVQVNRKLGVYNPTLLEDQTNYYKFSAKWLTVKKVHDIKYRPNEDLQLLLTVNVVRNTRKNNI
jgi:hypothetical protein